MKNTFISENEHSITEKYIENVKRDEWDKETVYHIFLKVVNDYIKYLSLDEAFRNRFIKNQNKDYDAILSKEYWDMVSLLEEKTGDLSEVPCCVCHGDLHFDNVMYDGEEIYYIDFEDSRSEIFFYDIFNIIFVEHMNYHSFDLIEEYFNDRSDICEKIRTIFDIVNYPFDKLRKLDYIKLYLLHRMIFDFEMLEERCAENGSDINESGHYLIEKYKEFLSACININNKRDSG